MKKQFLRDFIENIGFLFGILCVFTLGMYVNASGLIPWSLIETGQLRPSDVLSYVSLLFYLLAMVMAVACGVMDWKARKKDDSR